MKKPFTTLFILVIAFGAFSQGEVTMYNDNPILDNTGFPAGPATGGDFQVELIVGLTANTVNTPLPGSISPLNSGYFNGQGNVSIAFDGTAGTPVLGRGATIFYQVEAWSHAPTYEAAVLNPFALHGISSVNSSILGPVGSPPFVPTLAFRGFILEWEVTVPEPSTLTLGFLGLGLLARKRRGFRGDVS